MSVFIPKPKKGNTKECSNYCTIALISHASNREGNGTPLQYSYLENPMDGGVWWATVHGVAKESDVIQRLKNNSKMVCHPICDTNVYLVWTVKS